MLAHRRRWLKNGVADVQRPATELGTRTAIEGFRSSFRGALLAVANDGARAALVGRVHSLHFAEAAEDGPNRVM